MLGIGGALLIASIIIYSVGAARAEKYAKETSVEKRLSNLGDEFGLVFALAFDGVTWYVHIMKDDGTVEPLCSSFNAHLAITTAHDSIKKVVLQNVKNLGTGNNKQSTI
jgi:hypothetical protein